MLAVGGERAGTHRVLGVGAILAPSFDGSECGDLKTYSALQCLSLGELDVPCLQS